MATALQPGPDAKARLDKAQQHYDAYVFLKEDNTHQQWVVTTLFYSAAMVADAHALHRGGLTVEHGDVFRCHELPKESADWSRNKYVSCRINGARDKYLGLFHLSVRARYKTSPIKPEDVDTAEKWFIAFKKEVARDIDISW